MTDQQQETAYREWRTKIEPQPVPGKGRGLALATTEAVNPYSLMALGPDVSHWTPKSTDYSGCDFLIAKLGGSENAPQYGNPYSDDTLNYWAQVAYDLPNPQGGYGVPLIVYFMQNPRVYLDNQMTEPNLRQCSETTHPVFSEVLKAWHAGAAWKQIKEWFFDYEEASYWIQPPTDGDYWQRLFTDELRERFLHKFKANEAPYPFPKIPIGFYSRRSFMDLHYDGGKNPYSMWDYLHQHPEFSTWPANYPRKIPNVSVAEIRANWLPLASWVPYLLAEEDDPNHPLRELPWTYWQFSGEPDWNVFNGTPAELYKRLGFTPRSATTPPDPTPIPVPTVKYFATINKGITDLHLRSAPNTTAPILVHGFNPGVRFPVETIKVDGAITWAGLGEFAWFAVKQGTNAPYAVITEETV